MVAVVMSRVEVGLMVVARGDQRGLIFVGLS